MDNVADLGSFQILNNLVMCDCAEERERQQAEGKSSSSRQGEAAGAAASTPDCGFFTCGLGSIFSWRGGGLGGVCPSSGGWLPVAGTVLLLAMTVYMFRNAGKLFGTGNFSSLFPARRSSVKCG